MPESVSCPRCGCSCRVQPHDHANCVACFTSFRPSQVDTLTLCPNCGQMAADADGFACDPCRGFALRPQGEAVPLFTPAPAQMPGQTALEVS